MYCKQDWCNLYGLREKFFRRMFIILPPCLASSFPLNRNFWKGVRFSNKNFPELAPHKNVSAYFSPDYYTAPVLSLKPWSRSSGCVFDIFLSMMTRRIHECWHVRTNKCVRTNICKTSVFVVSVRNINICGRFLTQFTGLLRTNTVTAKRDLLTERTDLGKSVSVSLRMNGPKGLRNSRKQGRENSSLFQKFLGIWRI